MSKPSSSYPRDLTGYGASPPKARWPGGARLALQFVLNYEEGGENCVLHGDRASEAFLSEIVGAQPIEGERHMSMESLYEYGSRVGVWRILALFRRHRLPLTVYGVAMAMERNPAAVESMLEAGHEIASHGWRWINYQHVPIDEEREHMRRAIEIHTRLTGERPLGWYTGRTSPHTRRLVVEDGGFVYDADDYSDELPWYDTRHRKKDGSPQLIVPYTLDANDMRFATPQGFNSGEQFGQYLKDSFDVLYAEGGRMMSVGLHCRLVGRSGRLRALEKFLRYVKGKKVWVARRIDIARHWLKQHPPSEHMTELFEDLNPPERLLMGPGPINAHPRVLQAMAKPLLGQFDPQFREYMRQTSVLYRGVFQTANPWTMLIDGTARAGIEAALVSIIEPGERVLVPVFGRFGHLLTEIARRCGAEVHTIEVEWGRVFPDDQLVAAVGKHRPAVVAVCHGDTSTTMAQPLAALGRACRDQGALLYVDATATLGGLDLPVDRWQLDIVTAGLQKCMGGPSGSAPITLNERAEKKIANRKHTEAGIKAPGQKDGEGPIILSNYFDLAMIMDYWSDKALNHHTEATTMLYAARECARVVLQEGLQNAFERHARASASLTAGLKAMGLELFGDPAHKMANVTGVYIPKGVDGDRVRRAMLEAHNIEIGTSFGPLHGKIWRIGTMGYNARQDTIARTLAALETVLAAEGFGLRRGAATAAARAAWPA